MIETSSGTKKNLHKWPRQDLWSELCSLSLSLSMTLDSGPSHQTTPVPCLRRRSQGVGLAIVAPILQHLRWKVPSEGLEGLAGLEDVTSAISIVSPSQEKHLGHTLSITQTHAISMTITGHVSLVSWTVILVLPMATKTSAEVKCFRTDCFLTPRDVQVCKPCLIPGQPA